jgi:hypothetical protein
MSFVGDVLKDVQGIQYFYIVGLFIFMILFFVVLYRTMKIPKKDLEKFKTSILDDDNLESNEI